MATKTFDENGEVFVDDATISLQIQQFLDEWNYHTLHSLAGKWDHHRATIAALNLFVMHGVDLSPGEIQQLSTLQEAVMIERIVAKMSAECKVSFEHFVLQLQMIVSTATRVRRAVESGKPEAMEDSLGGCDSGLSAQIIKKAIVQGGIEVTTIRGRHETWKEATDARISRLVRSADSASNAQAQLKTVSEELQRFGGEQNDKAKKMMVSVALNNEKALLGSAFSGWSGIVAKEKAKAEIRRKFEAELDAKEQQLIEYRKHQLESVRAVFQRKYQENNGTLLQEAWAAWLEDMAETRRQGARNEENKLVEAKLAAFASQQADKAQKVMRQMIAGNDAALCGMVFSDWVEWADGEEKQREIEKAVKEKQAQIQAHLAKKKDEAKAILDRMNCATDTGLMEHVMSCWIEVHKEQMEENRMAALNAQVQDEFAALNGRQKDNVMGVAGRNAYTLDLNVCLKHFSAWALDMKCNRIAKYYTQKMEMKKQQLNSVQMLFRSFASQLDQGLAVPQAPMPPPPPSF